MSSVHGISVGLFLGALSTDGVTRVVCVVLAMVLSVWIAYRMIRQEVYGR